MIELFSLKKLSTHRRYILWSVVPTLLLSTALGLSFLWLRLNDLNKSQLDQGFSTLHNFSYLVQIALNGAPEDSIQEIAHYIVNNSAARSVNIFNSEHQRVASAGPDMSQALSADSPFLEHPHFLKTENSIRFYTPLREDLLSPVSSLTKRKTLIKNWGWIEIEIPSHETDIKRYQAFTLVTLVILVSWLLQLVIVLQRAYMINGLLSKFSQAYASLKSGNYKTSLRVNSPGDLGLLEAEFNSMCYALQQHQEELYRNMQQTNDDINETLETIEIQNIALDLARKEAIKASQSKSDFLAKMSHEIRTPLNGIIGFTHLLSKSNLSLRQQEQVLIIQKSAHSLLALINDILDFSKIEAGKLDIEQAPFNLRDAIEDVLEMLAPFAEEKRLELISLYYDDCPIHMVGDALRIKQIITNLINNAIKFSQQGDVVVRTMLESENDGGFLIKISITDKGQGLSKKDQELLFQSFSQLNNGSGNTQTGTGLGLVISKHLTELMGGNIACISEANQGATFWFTFQTRKDPMEQQFSNTMAFNHSNLALYDKNTTSRQAIALQLRQLGIQLDEFGKLDELTAQIRFANQSNASYQAVIMGLSYHEENDPLTPITIENIETALNCRVIVLNHAYAQQNLQALLDKSATVVLGKPLRHTQLLSALHNLLKRNNPAIYSKQAAIKTNTYFAKPPRILVVDDTPTNLQLLCIFLNQLGAEVTACASGKEAVALWENNVFDLIFMDYRMPDMNGLQATQAIRAKEKSGTHIPIIGLTAHAVKEEKLQLLAAGMDDCLTKPIDEKQLYQIILKWLNTQTPAPSQPTATDIAPSETTVVNIKECLRLVGGKAQLAKDMFDKFIVLIQQDKTRIVEHRLNNITLLDIVHSLHGAACYCGVPLLRAQLEKLEKLLHDPLTQHPQITLEVDILLAEIERVLDWAQQHPQPDFDV